MKFLKLKSIATSALLASGFILAFASCESTEDSKDVAKDMNEERFDDRDAEKDANFLVDAAAMLHKNVKLGELAASNSSSASVKELGSMIASMHANDIASLNSLASNKGIVLPDSASHNVVNTYNDLTEKRGLDFDKAYTDKVVSSHKDAIDKFEDIAENAKDAEIRTWATNMLPNLRDHLVEAEKAQQLVKDMK